MSEAIPVKISKKVFNKVYLPHLKNYARIQIFYGGSSSGKSFFLAQRTVHDILGGGRNYLITRAVARTIKKSVFQEVKKVIKAWKMLGEFKINETDLTITCNNGYQILFAGLDDVEKLKSITPAVGSITDVWIEEATEIQRNDLKQLIKRQRGGSEDTPKRVTISFNPILQSHWIYEDYFKGVEWTDDQTEYTSPELTILKTWFIHNQFLTKADKADLLGETDQYYSDVYTYGNWGVLGNIIFTNWRVEDLSDMVSQFTNIRNGLDFGFSSHPAALSVSHYDHMRKTIYIFDEMYEKGLTNDLLAIEVKNRIGDETVVCDSAEPKSITELQRDGISAIGAMKGKDSVNFGIDWLKQQTIVIDKKCINAKNEFQSYKWKEDKDGVAMRVPVDANNHFIDATRYAYEYDMEEIDPEKMVDSV
jgi:phage terminase large subunit